MDKLTDKLTSEQRVLEWVKNQSCHGVFSMFKISELEDYIANTAEDVCEIEYNSNPHGFDDIEFSCPNCERNLRVASGLITNQIALRKIEEYETDIEWHSDAPLADDRLDDMKYWLQQEDEDETTNT